MLVLKLNFLLHLLIAMSIKPHLFPHQLNGIYLLLDLINFVQELALVFLEMELPIHETSE